MKVSYLTPYSTTAGINAWLTNLIAATRHKVGWSMWSTSGQYMAQRYMRPLCDVNFSPDPALYLEMYMPDIIHMTLSEPIMATACAHREKYGTPIVITVHSRIEHTKYFAETLAKADVVILPSEDMYQSIDKWGCLTNHKMVYHGIVDFSHLDITPFDFREEFGIPEDHMIVGCVSRIAPDKGWETIIKLADMVAEFPISIVLAGSGTPRHEAIAMRNIAKRRNLYYTNGITPWSMPSFYRGIDCGVSVSPHESFGLAVCEMCWESIPVAALRGGAVVELLGDIGITADTIPDLARGLTELLDKNKRTKMGQSLRRRVVAKRLSADRMGKDYIDIFNEVLGCGGNDS